MATIDYPITGRFDLAQSIGFGFGGRTPESGGVMRMAFVVDGYDEQAAVAVTQTEPGAVRIETVGDADPSVVAGQAARILSLDVDATGYDRLVDGDELLASAYARRPGLRPPLFCSAYEGLTWAVLSARRPMRQMRAVWDRLSREHGRVFDVAGKHLAAFPTPAQLLTVAEFDGLTDEKLRRMHAIASAAGELDTETLRSRESEEVATQLRKFSGIGPFYSQLVTVRTLGHTDVLPTTEPRVIAATGARLGRQLTPTDFQRHAERWRPWRTWACVAIRAAG